MTSCFDQIAPEPCFPGYPETDGDPGPYYLESRRYGRQALYTRYPHDVGTIVGLLASGRTIAEVLAAYPFLEEEDIRQALQYAAWRVQEIEVPRPAA